MAEIPHINHDHLYNNCLTHGSYIKLYDQCPRCAFNQIADLQAQVENSITIPHSDHCRRQHGLTGCATCPDCLGSHMIKMRQQYEAQVAELEATKRTLNSMLSCAITNAHCPHCSTPMDATAMTGVYECGKCIEDYGGVSIKMQEAKAKEANGGQSGD